VQRLHEHGQRACDENHDLGQFPALVDPSTPKFIFESRRHKLGALI
jgi:hypothetical protein